MEENVILEILFKEVVIGATLLVIKSFDPNH